MTRPWTANCQFDDRQQHILKRPRSPCRTDFLMRPPPSRRKPGIQPGRPNLTLQSGKSWPPLCGRNRRPTAGLSNAPRCPLRLQHRGASSLVISRQIIAISGHTLGQLGDVHRDPPRLISRQQLCRRSPAGLLLDIRQRVAVGVLHDEAGVRFLDGPRRREAAGCHRSGWRHRSEAVRSHHATISVAYMRIPFAPSM